MAKRGERVSHASFAAAFGVEVASEHHQVAAGDLCLNVVEQRIGFLRAVAGFAREQVNADGPQFLSILEGRGAPIRSLGWIPPGRPTRRGQESGSG